MHRSVVILCTAALFGGFGPSCENEISQSVTSPSGAMKAVVFNRACGATVNFNTQVSVLPSNQRLPDDGGNVFIVDGSDALEIRWDSDSTLQISRATGAKIFRQETSVNGIRVMYGR